jgi:hypothetical protein
LTPTRGLRTFAHGHFENKAGVSLVGIASPITAPRGESEMVRKIGIAIMTGTVDVTGIAKETERSNGIVITGIRNRDRTETVIVMMT